MKLFKKIKTFNKENRKADKLAPFEKRENIHSLSAVFTIVNRGQANFFVDAYNDIGASISMVLYSYSMPPEQYRNILGADSTKKEIILTILREEDVKKALDIAKERFSISSAAKGIAFGCPIDSVSGIAVYKFLADQNESVRKQENDRK